MAVRSGMSDIITQVQYLIGDTGTATFTAQHVQDILDQHVTIVRYEPLTAVEDIGPNGTITYLEFWAVDKCNQTIGPWEGTAGTALVLQDANWSTVTGSVSTFTYLEGRFRFASEPTYPIYITGRTYDVEGAAADLCVEWIAILKKCVTFSQGSTKFDLNAQIANLELLAENLRRRQAPNCVTLTRNDVNDAITFYGDDPRRYTSSGARY